MLSASTTTPMSIDGAGWRVTNVRSGELVGRGLIPRRISTMPIKVAVKIATSVVTTQRARG
jgi:hypothetical protein